MTKDTRLFIRITSAEKGMIQKLAAKAKKTISDYVKAAALGGSK